MDNDRYTETSSSRMSWRAIIIVPLWYVVLLAHPLAIHMAPENFCGSYNNMTRQSTSTLLVSSLLVHLRQRQKAIYLVRLERRHGRQRMRISGRRRDRQLAAARDRATATKIYTAKVGHLRASIEYCTPVVRRRHN